MGCGFCFFFFNDTATTEIYTLSLHDALPISFFRLSRETRACRCTSRAAPHHPRRVGPSVPGGGRRRTRRARSRSCGRAVWTWNPPAMASPTSGKGGDNPSGRGEPLAFLVSLGTNADDRLPRAPLGRVEGGDGIIEGRDGPDVRPQSSVPHPLDDLTQLGTIGLDNEVDRKAINGPRLRRPDDGHQRSSGPNQARGPLPDVAAD